jgi:hypothetical protein
MALHSFYDRRKESRRLVLALVVLSSTSTVQSSCLQRSV